MVYTDRCLGHFICCIKAQQVGVEVVRDSARYGKHQHICMAVIVGYVEPLGTQSNKGRDLSSP